MIRPADTCQVLLALDDPAVAGALADRLQAGDPAIVVERVVLAGEALEHRATETLCDALLLALEPEEPDDLARLGRLRAARPDLALLALVPDAASPVRGKVLAAGAHECLTPAEIHSPLLSRLVRHAVRGIKAEALHKLNREASQLLDANPDGVLVVDADGIVRYVNPAANALFAGGGDSLVGEWLGFSVTGDHTDLELLGNSTPRTGQMRVAEIEWQGEPALLASIRDVTETRELSEQLREAQKMEVTGLLAGGLAHDFNNLLVVIMGNVEFLLSACPADDPRRAMVERIDAAAERARQLTRQLLMFSRRQANRPVVLDPNRVMLKLFNMLRRSFPSNIDLVVLPMGETWRVYLDPNEFDQILINLAFNARHAMPAGGRVEINLANERLTSRLGRLPPGDYVKISVVDDGVGIEAKDLPNIFDAFFTTRSAGSGTGLGLTICQRIVRRVGGEILVDSTPGKGSVFTIYLPRCEAEAELVPADESASAHLRGNERILLVEDDAAVAEAVQQSLVDSGFRTTHAADGRQAMRIIEQAGQDFDLILSDVVMPLMTGLELSAWLKETRPSAKLLLMTGYADNVEAFDRPSATRGLIYKPFMPSQLLRAIRAMLDGTTG